MVNFVTFSKDQMLNILWGDAESTAEIISDNIVDTSRWNIQHELIFKLDGKFYRAWYEVGATEYQDTGPWEHEDEVKCVEVTPVEKTVIVYEPI